MTIMEQSTTKAALLDEIRSTHEAYQRLVSGIEPARMTAPRTVGEWAVKDVIFHCTRYAGIFVDALQANLRGEPPPAEVIARPDLAERNQAHFKQSQLRTHAQVLAEAEQVFQRFVEAVEAEPEAFLIEPQRFEGVAEPVLVVKNLQHVCEHYRGHMREIREGLEDGHI